MLDRVKELRGELVEAGMLADSYFAKEPIHIPDLQEQIQALADLVGFELVKAPSAWVTRNVAGDEQS